MASIFRALAVMSWGCRSGNEARVYRIDPPVSCCSGYTWLFTEHSREAVLISQPKHIIAIASGKGGVGKSTVTMNLAIALKSMGFSVGVLDADVYGPSQQHMLGVADSVTPEQKDGKYLLPVETQGIKAMSMGFLAGAKTPMVWRGPMASGALMQMLDQTLWGDLDLLLVDMPPGTGDIQLTLAQKAALSGAVIVTTPQDIALLDAQKGVEMFAKVGVPILGVVQNMAVHICQACGHEEHIFGADGAQRLAKDYGVTVLADLPLSGALRAASDNGESILVAAPESPEAQAVRAAAAALINKLNTLSAPSSPTISMSDD